MALRSPRRRLDVLADADDPARAFDTTGLPKGTYDVVLIDGSGTRLSRDSSCWSPRTQRLILSLLDDTLEDDEEL